MAYGLLGRKLSHSWSPAIHELLGSAPYTLFEKEPEEVGHFLATAQLAGLNVTIPYKKTVLPYCTSLSDTARKLGSVNTLMRTDNGWHGHNTDYFGFCRMLQEAGISPKGEKILVLGSGGASATVVQVLKDLGAKDVLVISRTGENNYENLHLHADAGVIVNTTPVGMYPDTEKSPVDLSGFPHCRGVLDLIYNPQRTALLMQAEALGLPHAGGLTMLTAQAKEAAELFLKRSIADNVIPHITRKLTGQMENIILIGMPGCGKSTVAELLAEMTGRRFLDADREIEKAAGMSIPEIFRQRGEAGFRAMETQTLRELGKESGLILATGGGCVTQKENYTPLHQNGKIIWLQRDPASLPTDGRPLSQSGNLMQMYEKRKPQYEAFADLIIENSSTPQAAANAILEALS